MAHIRTRIRDAIVARLAADGAFALVAGYGRTARPLQSDDFPAAFVRITEVASPAFKSGHILRRSLSVAIDILESSDVDDLDTRLDDLAVRVEAVLADGASLGVGPLLEWDYAGTTPGTVDLGEQIYGSATVNFSCSVSTERGKPSANAHQ